MFPTAAPVALGLGLAAVLSLAPAASASTYPAIGFDTQGPQVILNLSDFPTGSCSLTGDDCTVTVTVTGQPSYNPFGDIYFGVQNNSPVQVTFLNLLGPGIDAFQPNHGIDSYGAASNGADTTGYGGPNAYFVSIGQIQGLPALHLLFVDPIQPGGTSYFSLPAMPLRVDNGVPEPGVWMMLLTGAALAGGALRRRRVASVTV